MRLRSLFCRPQKRFELADGGCFGEIRVFNTGVDDSRLSLPGGSVDPYCKLVQSAQATLVGPDAIVTLIDRVPLFSYRLRRTMNCRGDAGHKALQTTY